MSVPSLWRFGWFRGGKLELKGEYIVRTMEKEPEWYHPMEHVQGLLSAIQKVRDADTAIRFCHDWGLLGFQYDAAANEYRAGMLWGAADMAEFLGLSPDEAFEQARKLVLSPERPEWGGDRVEEVLRFAAWARHVAMLRRLDAAFREEADEPADPWRETREWLAGLDTTSIEELFGAVAVFESLEQQYARGGFPEDSFEHYVVSFALHQQRFSFSHRSRRGVWVALHTPSYSTKKPQGQPVIMFDALFRFIEYVLLVDGGLEPPRRCADPKCGALFFPTRKGQRYCPPPPGARRSRCENRHGVERRRQRWLSEKELSALVDLGKESGKEPGSSFPENG